MSNNEVNTEATLTTGTAELTTIYPFRTSNYSMNIYLFGSARFTARDGFNGIPLEYHEPVKQNVANDAELYPQESIDKALTMGWINQEEYDQTMVYVHQARGY